ncbi:hypothetical protein FOCC_FOCC016140 [Frankliniella occidentalis]|nr:hypothetical protein FOCC_FOCC016140 [Frankliniella occidentalis]
MVSAASKRKGLLKSSRYVGKYKMNVAVLLVLNVQLI